MNTKSYFKYYIASFCLAFSVLFIIFLIMTSSKFNINHLTPDYPQNNVYLPDKNDNFTFLLGISENKSDLPFDFFLINFNVSQGNIPIINLPFNLYIKSKDSTLGEIFAEKGFDEVKNSLENLTEQSISKYICLNKATLEYITSLCGNIKINLPYKIRLPNQIILKEGEQLLNGGFIFEILNNHKNYKTNISSEIISQIVNITFPLFPSGKGERIFNFTVNNCYSNISYKDFQKILNSVEFLVKLNSTPAFPLTLTGKHKNDVFYFDDFSLKSLKEIISQS